MALFGNEELDEKQIIDIINATYQIKNMQLLVEWRDKRKPLMKNFLRPTPETIISKTETEREGGRCKTQKVISNNDDPKATNF
jgi:hypothetical protein